MLKQLQSLAAEYAQTHDGRWLNEFDWKSVPVDKIKQLSNKHTLLSNLIAYNIKENLIYVI